MQAGVTAGTVLAVLLPVFIAMLCYASYVRNKQRADFPDGPVRRGLDSRRSFNQFFPRSKRDSSPEPRPGRNVDLRAGDASPGLKHSDDTQV